MSNYPALLNLVRNSSLATTEGLDVESGSTVYTHPDEVLLTTPDGDPCALVSDAWQNNDINYDYVNGSVGYTAKRARHLITFSVDFLGNETIAKLSRWKHERATLSVCQGYGRYTDVAYRPVVGTGSAVDMTNRYTLACASPASSYWWDAKYQVMRGAWTGSNPHRVVRTEYGNCQVFQHASTNRHIPGTPAAATEGFAGASGWRKGGANAADLTFSLVSGGFGHDDMPHSIRVTTTNDASHTRYLIAQTLWDDSSGDYGGYEFTGAGTATAVVWIKGRGCLGSYAQFYLNATSYQTQPLSAYDLSEWTPIYFSVYSADWSDAVPSLKIDLSSGANAERADIEVGPVAVFYTAGRNAASRPEWSASAASLGDSYMSIATYTMPQSGSLVASFYCPAGYTGPTNKTLFLAGADDGPRLTITTGGVLTLDSGVDDDVSGNIAIEQGKINVVAATWGTSGRSLYWNGGIVDASVAADQDMLSASGTFYFGGSGDWSCHPLLLHSARIDAKLYSADDIGCISKALTDEAANAVSMRARGRTYRITKLPSTPRSTPAGTRWVGTLELEELTWSSAYSDLGSYEVM